MGALIFKFMIFGGLIFLPVIGLIYGYKKITKKEFQHTLKVLIGATITFGIIMAIASLEGL